LVSVSGRVIELSLECSDWLWGPASLTIQWTPWGFSKV